ncbi:MAG: uroporphyrinogen-III synthase [Pseudomonadota bacterium]
MNKQLTVLITRPQPGADAFAAMLQDLRVVVSPLMVIENVDGDLGAADVVVITSAHAIPALDGQRCYSVGQATTEAARAAGCDAVMAGETAEAVAQRVIADKPEGRIVYARGQHVAFDMVGALQAAGLTASDVVVYDQRDTVLSEEAKALLSETAPVIVPLFSARSARRFFEVCPEGADLRVIAMSEGVADMVPEAQTRNVTISPNPDAATMAEAVRNAS